MCLLLQFVDIESAICTTSDVPCLNYGPGNSGFNYVMDRPITVSGNITSHLSGNRDLLIVLGS